MRFVAACAVMILAWEAHAAPAPIARFTVTGAGFIDDGYVLSDDGKAVAYIITDGATSASLPLAEVGGADVQIEGAPIDVAALHWVAPGRVLVVEHREGPETARLFTAKGAAPVKLGPFDQLALATIDGRRAVV